MQERHSLGQEILGCLFWWVLFMGGCFAVFLENPCGGLLMVSFKYFLFGMGLMSAEMG